MKAATLLLAVFFLFLVGCAPELVLKPTPTKVETVAPSATTTLSVPTKTIASVPTSTPKKTENTTRYCVVETGLDNGNANIRSGPSAGYEVILVTNEGEEVEILDTFNEWWFLVRKNGKLGYISTILCKEITK